LGYRHLLLKGGPMYEPLVKIPLIIKFPASWGKKGVEHDLSSNIDIAGTILSVCGMPPTPGMQGCDLTKSSRRKVVICEKLSKLGNGKREYMIRTKTHKLLLGLGKDETRLFNIADDPLETNDIAPAPENRTVIADLKELLIEEMLLNGNDYPYLDLNAPVINSKTYETVEKERTSMIAYMKEKSKVKPSGLTL
ncbi:MAG: hypothetical protein FWD78_18010, partial [Treponema sp.]|nr:hypothetical protein [Treponema sp.]